MDTAEQHLTLEGPVSSPDGCAYERLYALPPELVLQPEEEYRISGWLRDQKKSAPLFKFAFRTDRRGSPVAY